VKCPACATTFITAPAEEELPPAPPPGRRAQDPHPAGEYDDERPRRPPRRYEEEHEERPRRRRYEDEEFRRRPGRTKPQKVQAVGIMMLVGGIVALLVALAWLPATCGLWPGAYYSVVVGILALIRASALLGDRAYRQPRPTGIAIMQIINVINGDMINLTLGILELVFLNDDEAKDYLRD